ncbi:hypothetical protein [Kineothrix sedimenti]|uniref:Uncharacterized protein n=1 Tax=Kineothrix sedimenti TaxID=3123317 RepID=A0ABZ3EUQ1_9FIRM
MINASKEFKEKLSAGANLVNYADIILANGAVLNLTFEDFMIGGCDVADATTSTNGFSIGNAIGKTVSLLIANHDDRFSEYDFYNSIIYLYVAMALENGTIEKVKKGKYYVNNPETPGDVISIDAVDSMVNFDKSYSDSNTSYPATLQVILADACIDCAVTSGFGQFNNYNFVVNERPEGVTYRQVVSYVAQIAGCNARMSVNDTLELVQYDTSALDTENYDGGLYADPQGDNTIDGGLFTDSLHTDIIDGGLFTDNTGFYIYDWKNLYVATDDVVITGIRVITDDNEFLFGSTDYALTVENNPFVEGKEQTVANYLGALLVGIRFRPFEGQTLGNPLIEPFDVGYISDRKGNTYRTVVNYVNYIIGADTSIACKADAPLRNSSRYRSEAARAIVEARRNTKKELSAYDKQVQAMNQLAMNAMGFRESYEYFEDGSWIKYMHDKPTIAESRIVYKMTADGFFLSQDGGVTYTGGWDSNNNVVVNMISAVGIICDWIKGGTLSLGGDNDTDGVEVVKNASGTQVVRLDKGGIDAIAGRIGGWLIGSDYLETGNAIIRSFYGNDKTNRATMSNASFKVWVDEVEKCYLGRGGYNGRGSLDSGLLFVNGDRGVELDGKTGNVNAGGNIRATQDIEANGTLRSQGNFICSGTATFAGGWTGTATVNGVTFTVKSGLITNIQG